MARINNEVFDRPIEPGMARNLIATARDIAPYLTIGECCSIVAVVQNVIKRMKQEKEDDRPTVAETVEENSEDVKRKLTRADILHAAEKCVCGQRETDYGTPEDNFKAIAELWSAYLDRMSVGKYGNTIVEAKDVAAMMALLKIARIAAGGGKADSWIDLAGYAACGAECEEVTE